MQEAIKEEIFRLVGTNTSSDILAGLKMAATLPEKIVKEFERE